VSLKTKVKISNVTNLSDARYCAGMGVDMLGFDVDEQSENYTSPKKLQEIRSWLAGIQIVIEIAKSESDNNLSEVIISYNPDMIQVNSIGLLKDIKAITDKPLILSIEANQDADTIFEILNKNKDLVDCFLLESQSELPFSGDWPDFLQLLSNQFSILLGFGITTHNVLTLPSVGIALRGGVEERPGYKDFGDLMDILEILEND
jgi:phosphoribosylanthranilate isomerase